jgi:hypothetical protein
MIRVMHCFIISTTTTLPSGNATGASGKLNSDATSTKFVIG